MEINLEILITVILENKQDKLIGECLKRQLNIQPKINPIEAIAKITEESKVQVGSNHNIYLTVAGKPITIEKETKHVLVLQGFKECHSKLALVKYVKDYTYCDLRTAKNFIDKLENQLDYFGVLSIDSYLPNLGHSLKQLSDEFPELNFHIHTF